MKHTIVIGSWGRDAVVVCQTCATEESPNGEVLLRSATEVPLVDAVAAIEAHTGEGAFRATIGGQPVDGQIKFPPPYIEQRKAQGLPPLETEEDAPLVAYGPPDDFGPGYHPRTGQRLEITPDQPVPFRHHDGGPSLKEFLESKGER